MANTFKSRGRKPPEDPGLSRCFDHCFHELYRISAFGESDGLLEIVESGYNSELRAVLADESPNNVENRGLCEHSSQLAKKKERS